MGMSIIFQNRLPFFFNYTSATWEYVGIIIEQQA